MRQVDHDPGGHVVSDRPPQLPAIDVSGARIMGSESVYSDVSSVSEREEEARGLTGGTAAEIEEEEEHGSGVGGGEGGGGGGGGEGESVGTPPIEALARTDAVYYARIRERDEEEEDQIGRNTAWPGAYGVNRKPVPGR